MSVKSLSPKHQALIAVILVAGAIVTVLNIRTFAGPRKGRRPVAARAQAFAVLPGDLETMVRDAGRDMRAGAPDGADAGSHFAAPDRDPFLSGNVDDTVMLPSSGGDPLQGGTVEAAPVLACTAVLPGGSRPMAVLAGKTVAMGGRVQGWRVEKITAAGVTLRSPDGATRVLPVVSDTGAGRISVSVGAGAASMEKDKERMEP